MAFSFRSLFSARGPVVPVIRLSGAIGLAIPFRPGVSLAAVEPQLERAFAIRAAPAVAVVINSPGGSAVQSHLIYKRIRALADEKRKKVIVAVEDVAASGGYLVALAGDEIIVDQSSIIGSIGVVAAMFGFPKLLDRLGVERRVHTAGKNKDMLDPFLPERPDDVARLQALQQEIHVAFIDLVKARRGAALADDPDLFTGAFWTGGRARSLGLVDRVGELREVLRERYGEGVVMKTMAVERGFFRRRLGFSRREGAAMSLIDQAIALLEERLLWSRFGL
jgi:signal peptide peptidase SppA